MNPVMSCEEIRHWMRELHVTYGWPWETLARTLGIGEGKHVVSKVRGNSYFRGGEQRRCSRQLDRILSGELVPWKPERGRVEAVVADKPVPLTRPARFVYNLKIGKLGYVVPRMTMDPILPSFATFFTDAVPLEDIKWRA
jgi:hypothetical protein